MAKKRKNQRVDLSARLRKYIEESGLSRYEICKKAGIDQSNLSRFMHGTRSITLETADAIAKVLGITFTRESDSTPS